MKHSNNWIIYRPHKLANFDELIRTFNEQAREIHTLRRALNTVLEIAESEQAEWASEELAALMNVVKTALKGVK